MSYIVDMREKRSVNLDIRLSPDELAAIQRIASLAHLSASTWARQQLLDRLSREDMTSDRPLPPFPRNAISPP